jgi:hypothetical protein
LGFNGTKLVCANFKKNIMIIFKKKKKKKRVPGQLFLVYSKTFN